MILVLFLDGECVVLDDLGRCVVLDVFYRKINQVLDNLCVMHSMFNMQIYFSMYMFNMLSASTNVYLLHSLVNVANGSHVCKVW
jgi:hypothetical protein